VHALVQDPDVDGGEAKAPGAERIYGSTIDFVSVAFLARGVKAAQAVGRVAFRDGQAQGSGVMVSDRLFLTNNHVIGSSDAADQFCVEFDYELDPADRPMGPTRFTFAPSDFFLTDGTDDLDYTLIAVGPRISGPKELSSFGWCPLSGAKDKHALGEVANIVQHPDGRYKEVVLRENRLVSRLSRVLHYVADTEPGSSGSPVFNNEWRIIALHHWGGPWRQRADDQGRPVPLEVNEGIRVSAIISELRERIGELPPGHRALLQQMLSVGEALRDPPDRQEQSTDSTNSLARVGTDGTITWQIPIELSVRLPHLSPAPLPAPKVVEPAVTAVPLQEARLKPSQEYDDRSGYKAGFIPGFRVDLPNLTRDQERDAARNREAEPGDDPFELKYHHFSIVMNGRRRLAFFTACNIDGGRLKNVDRNSGAVTPLEPGGVEALGSREGAEASETWYDDRRLDSSEYAGREIYEDQEVPGFPDRRSTGRTLRMFQRGHLVRRMDPAWGTDRQALQADADTFHWTNCSPQVGFFNMGKAGSLRVPNSAGGQLWRAIENYVLRNALVESQRISVFTGPVFDDKRDRSFRDIKVPGLFWKIVAWAEGGELRSVAMLADQRPVITVWPEALGENLAEAFGDPDELEKVEDFLTSVREIEKLTGLSFGDALRAADIRAGERTERITRVEEITFTPRPRRAQPAKGSGRKSARSRRDRSA
jgi:endonuclease G